MSDSIVIIASCGTDNPNRATRALHLATIAHREGKKATLFLLDEGVYLAKKGLTENLIAATGDSADDHLTYLQTHQVPIIACTPCVKSRGISDSEMVEGSRLGTAVELVKLVSGASVISL